MWSSSDHCTKYINHLFYMVRVYSWTQALQQHITWRLVSDVLSRPLRAPPPTMTSPARVSTWISRKPWPAVKQGLKRQCGAGLPPDSETGCCWTVGQLRCSVRTRNRSLRRILVHLWPGPQLDLEQYQLHLPWLPQQQADVRRHLDLA